MRAYFYSFVLLFSFFVLASCSTSAKNIEPLEIDREDYFGLSCDQLRAEKKFAQDRLEYLTGTRTSERSSETLQGVMSTLFLAPGGLAINSVNEKENHEIAKSKGVVGVVDELLKDNACK